MTGHLGDCLIILEKTLEAGDQRKVGELGTRLAICLKASFVTDGARRIVNVSSGVRNTGIGAAVVYDWLDSSQNTHPAKNDER